MIKLSKIFMTNLSQNSNKFHLIIQTNSPGELAAWVRPVVKTCQQRIANLFITVCLVPCQYATGQEATVAATIEGVDQVLTPKQTVLFLFGFSSLSKQAKQGAVLCLGGDPFYSQLLAWRLGFSASVYTEHRKKPGMFFKHIFYKHTHGDLMQVNIAHYLAKAPSREALLKQYSLPDRSYVLVFLGSRPHHFKAFGKVALDAIRSFLLQQSSIDVLVSIAPTISDDVFQSLDTSSLDDRVFFLRGNSLDFMTIAMCMMSLPGTNTAEAMYMQLPMVTVLPLNRPDLLELDGLVGLLGSLPFFGKFIKQLAIYIYLKKRPFVSLPNRIAGTMIIPEWVRNVSASQLADDLGAFATDQALLNKIRHDLKSICSKNQIDSYISDTISS